MLRMTAWHATHLLSQIMLLKCSRHASSYTELLWVCLIQLSVTSLSLAGEKKWNLSICQSVFVPILCSLHVGISETCSFPFKWHRMMICNQTVGNAVWPLMLPSVNSAGRSLMNMAEFHHTDSPGRWSLQRPFSRVNLPPAYLSHAHWLKRLYCY